VCGGSWYRRVRPASPGPGLCVLAIALSVMFGATSAAYAAPQRTRSFSLRTAADEPIGVTTGPDGDAWVTQFQTSRVLRVSTAGAVTVFALPGSRGPLDITGGPDDAVWFTELGHGTVPQPGIGRLASDGTFREFTAGIGEPQGITSGPDGALWFTDVGHNSIGRLTVDGQLREFVIPTTTTAFNGGTFPDRIVVGPDGNLWFTEAFTGNIGRITPAGVITEFFAHFANNGGPVGLTVGTDGALWFANPNDRVIGRMTTRGLVTALFHAPAGVTPYFITAGSDANLWFADDGGSAAVGVMTPHGRFHQVATPAANWNLTSGPDHAIWISEATAVVRICDERLTNHQGCGPRASIDDSSR
jgi:virginiamycin B lyase